MAIKHKQFFLFRHKLNLILIFGLLLVFILAIIISKFEDFSSISNIRSPFDAVWWAVSTVTAVGYGDKYPVTIPGKLLAIVVMFIGITLFSLLTANIASFLVEEDEEKELIQIKDKIDSLEKKIDKLLDK